MGKAIRLEPLEDEDRERFILDNQEAFNYGALEEFGGARRALRGGRPDHIAGDRRAVHRRGRGVPHRSRRREGRRRHRQGRGRPRRARDTVRQPKRTQQGHRLRRVVRDRTDVPRGQGLGARHAVLRDAQHPLLREPLRFPHRRVLQQPLPGPERPGRRGNRGGAWQ